MKEGDKIIAPKLYELSAFDATKESTFTFNWSGAQARGNKLEVYNNETNTIIYSSTQTTMKLEHVIPANTLQNGVCYNAVIYVLDSNSTVISDVSNTIIFFCFTTPTFQFLNITDNFIIENSNFDVSISYIQPEGEILTQYQFQLCDLSKTAIQTKGIQYLVESVDTVQSRLSGLENNSSYYIRATGKTLNGMLLDTGYVLVNVRYLQPSLFSRVELTNMEHDGYIVIRSNLITIEGTSYPPVEDLTFIDGTMVDLHPDNYYISFSEGFEFPENFCIGLVFKGADINLDIMYFHDTMYYATLYYREGCFESQKNELKGYFELQVDMPLGHAIYTTDYIDPVSPDQLYTIWITKNNNIYQVQYFGKKV